jgi:hypothetical protein
MSVPEAKGARREIIAIAAGRLATAFLISTDQANSIVGLMRNTVCSGGPPTRVMRATGTPW